MRALLFVFLLFTQAQEKPVYPTYEQEVNDVMALLNQDQLAASYIRHKFNEVTELKRKEVGEFERKTREIFSKESQAARTSFENKLREETKAWQKDNPKGKYVERQEKVSAQRQTFNDDMSAKRKASEQALRDKNEVFREFLKIRTEEFNKKIDAYGKKMEETRKTIANDLTPLQKEFKEIPKGPGIQLSPGKE